MRGPVGRPVASRLTAEDLRADAVFRAVSPPNDPAASSRLARITPTALDGIEQALLDRERRVLEFVAEHRLATGGQLARRFWSDEGELTTGRRRRARRVLEQLTALRVLDRLPRRVGGVRAGSDSFVYAIGAAGVRLLARWGRPAARPDAPGDRFVRHTLVVTEFAVRLHEAHDRGDLELIELQNEPASWRPFVAAGGARLILKPDLFIRLGAGDSEDHWFLEADLATEARRTLIAKGRRYFDHFRSGQLQHESGAYPRVLWAVPDAHRAALMQDAFDRLPSETKKLFTICRFTEAVDLLAAEARL